MSDQRWLNALFNIGWLALRWHLQDLLAKAVWPTSKQLGWWALWRWADVICQCWANNSANKISTLVQWMTLHAIRETGLRFSFKQLGNQRWNMALPPKNKVEMSTSILISNPIFSHFIGTVLRCSILRHPKARKLHEENLLSRIPIWARVKYLLSRLQIYLTWAESSCELFWERLLYVVCLRVSLSLKLIIYSSSSQEPLGQFQSNVAQNILG